MPTIEVSQEIFQRLQKLAVPLVDTTETVLRRLLDAYEKSTFVPEAKLPSVTFAPPSGFHLFDSRQPPDLTHTKLLSASFGGVELPNPNWKRLLEHAVQRATRQSINWESIGKLASIRIVPGEKVDEGFHFLPEANVSVQGQDANAAWRATVSLARTLTCNVEATFKWREKDGATRPGASGRFHFP